MQSLTNPMIQFTASDMDVGKASSKTLVLREGQMMHGKVQQLFPGQLAEIQVGQHKLTASLEMPMRAGESYYFQVSATKPEVQLKVLSGPIGQNASKSAQIQQLVQALQLPNRPETTVLLQHLLAQKVPVQRDQIMQAIALLQQISPKDYGEAVQAIQKMVENTLPLSSQVFEAAMFGHSKKGLHTEIQGLQQLLISDRTTPKEMRQSLIQTIERLQHPLLKTMNASLISQSLITLTSEETTGELKFTALQLLKEIGIVPKRAAMPNISQQLQAFVSRAMNTTVSLQQPFPPQQVQTLINELPFLTMTERQQLIETAHSLPSEQFSTQIISSVLKNIAHQPQQMELLLSKFIPSHKQLMTLPMVEMAKQHMNPFMETLVQRAEAVVTSAIDGGAMKEMLQTITRFLGVQYEKGLLESEQQIHRIHESLKPQLLQLSQQITSSQAIREAAEHLFVRMNGAPIASTDQAGQQQLMMHMPLEVLGKKIDATIEWNGRQKEDGKIDANHARVLFYLDLHALKEMVVDMQVQNRVITVTIFNDSTALSQVGQPLIARLKENLAVIDYQLSGVLFKPFEPEKVPVSQAKMSNSTGIIGGEGKGVDLRI